ncbi:uncharacterized protein LOC131161364 [Malania oleifera]|uniref:uncharacterized protein LOC131161364 n=1 Tax=Malania oleifera TaxID=397392 RepID=UPI0025AE866F|nr:uncharacterized protein LOC131161364 [Malania oleifera]XP_057973067.1 uncharacterized protein LOC131161364 [Malania oleifera]XP_057973068.1 uncharacterized protein LOC131161364 [Malania oleifera]
MDIEQEELQFLGLFGICKEAYKIITSWRKLFCQITLSLIFPLSFIFLAHVEVSNTLFRKINRSEIELDKTAFGTPKYDKLSDLLSSEWTALLLFKAAYFTFFLIFSLLSTAAVVYAIACIYTARDLTFRKVMSVVPRVWKRLMATFMCLFIALFTYHVVAVIVFVVWIFFVGPSRLGMSSLVVFLIVYFVGFLYMSIIWQLASVVSVLEEAYGAQALIKSRRLVKGKMRLAAAIFLKLNFVSAVLMQIGFQRLVVNGEWAGVVGRVAYAVLCFLLLSMLFLYGLVIQTILYFICKSYHHESIDKSALSDHLEVYGGEYVPLKGKDVQLEQFYV